LLNWQVGASKKLKTQLSEPSNGLSFTADLHKFTDGCTWITEDALMTGHGLFEEGADFPVKQKPPLRVRLVYN